MSVAPVEVTARVVFVRHPNPSSLSGHWELGVASGLPSSFPPVGPLSVMATITKGPVPGTSVPIVLQVNMADVLCRPDASSICGGLDLVAPTDLLDNKSRLITLPISASWKARVVAGLTRLGTTPGAVGPVSWWTSDPDRSEDPTSWSSLLWKVLSHRFQRVALELEAPIASGMKGSERGLLEARRQDLATSVAIIMITMALMVKDGLTLIDPQAADRFTDASKRLRTAILSRVAARCSYPGDAAACQQVESDLWASIWNPTFPPALAAAHDRWMLTGATDPTDSATVHRQSARRL